MHHNLFLNSWKKRCYLLVHKLLVSLGSGENDIDPNPHCLWRGSHQIIGSFKSFHGKCQFWVRWASAIHMVYIYLFYRLKLEYKRRLSACQKYYSKILVFWIHFDCGKNTIIFVVYLCYVYLLLSLSISDVLISIRKNRNYNKVQTKKSSIFITFLFTTST